MNAIDFEISSIAPAFADGAQQNRTPRKAIDKTAIAGCLVHVFITDSFFNYLRSIALLPPVVEHPSFYPNIYGLQLFF